VAVESEPGFFNETIRRELSLLSRGYWVRFYEEAKSYDGSLAATRFAGLLHNSVVTWPLVLLAMFFENRRLVGKIGSCWRRFVVSVIQGWGRVFWFPMIISLLANACRSESFCKLSPCGVIRLGGVPGVRHCLPLNLSVMYPRWQIDPSISFFRFVSFALLIGPFPWRLEAFEPGLFLGLWLN